MFLNSDFDALVWLEWTIRLTPDWRTYHSAHSVIIEYCKNLFGVGNQYVLTDWFISNSRNYEKFEDLLAASKSYVMSQLPGVHL